jgi:myosin heavy subunit
MFNWLVYKLNLNLYPPGYPNCKQDTIGILDIFGFENFDVNTLEQLCINFANEKLQQIYIQYVFEGEAKIFQDEGLLEFIKGIKFADNKEVIALLDQDTKPKGVY